MTNNCLLHKNNDLVCINDVINPANIRRQNIPYLWNWILYYAWVIVFTTWWTASPVTDELFGANSRVALHSINLMASALFVCILKKDWFVKTVRLGAPLVLAAALLFLAAKNPTLHVTAIIALGMSLGLVNSGIIIPFVFVLNNTEKLYAVLLANTLISALVLLQELGWLDTTNGMGFSFIMLIASLLPLVKFSLADLEKSRPPAGSFTPSVRSLIYVTIIINCLYAILCKGFGKMFVLVADQQSPSPLGVFFYAGALAGCGLYWLIYALTKRSNLLTWNLIFGSFVMGMLLYATADGNVLPLVVFALFLGIGSSMGMINMYYILGVIGKKYQSLAYLRVSILFIGITGGIVGSLLGKWAASFPTSLALTLAGLITITIILLLMVSPILAESYFSDDWAPDSQKPEIDNDKQYLFEKYHLTPRENIICRLLLEGYTLRQIALTLHLAYPTVNTYQTSLYRKLHINSKTELFLMFKEQVSNKIIKTNELATAEVTPKMVPTEEHDERNNEANWLGRLRQHFGKRDPESEKRPRLKPGRTSRPD